MGGHAYFLRESEPCHETGSITRIQHDAAIVFAPRPYILVVLVRGIDDEKKGYALIAAIARLIDHAERAAGRP